MVKFLRFGFALLLVLSLDQCKQPSVPVPVNTPTRDGNMAMGNPDGAKALLITKLY
ncbi:hypothetical protein [Spirosoma migulaei]